MMRRLIKIVENAERALPLAIGWDFDNTLVDAPTSPLLHAFIIEHPEIRHCIVTFRTHGMRDAIWRDLAQYPDAPAPSMFQTVFSISDAAWMENEMALLQRRRGTLTGPWTPPEIYYRSWKALTCLKHRLSVLVDDDLVTCQAGCDEHAIKLVHPEAFAHPNPFA